MNGAVDMRSLELEPAPAQPTDFAGWYEEIGLFADLEGEAALIGVVMGFAPMECVRFLGAQPLLWVALVARARYADWQRFTAGLRNGRRVGL